MADASDSKSDVGDYVWVQVPSPALLRHVDYTICLFLLSKRQRIVYQTNIVVKINNALYSLEL